MTPPSSAKPEETVERMRQEVEGGGKKLTRDVYKKIGVSATAQASIRSFAAKTSKVNSLIPCIN